MEKNSLEYKLTNIRTGLKQATNLQVKDTPNLGSVNTNVLNSASDKGFKFSEKAKVDLNPSEQAIQNCRKYNDITSLRELQQLQMNSSEVGAKCGWLYKPSQGIAPEISRGELGLSGTAVAKDIPAGANFYWDLHDAEKEISKKICSNATKCKHLASLGNFTNICGYCKTSGTIIPITNDNKARYPKDNALNCATGDILTATTVDKCPVEEFSDFGGSRLQHGMGVKGNLIEAFDMITNPNKLRIPAGVNIVKEGFVSLHDIDNCTTLDSDECKKISLQLAGCKPEGALYTALETNTLPQLYESAPFKAYQQHAVGSPLNENIFKSGNVAVKTALDNLQDLVSNTNVKDKKISLAARDLCLKKGEYDMYDFCSEIQENTIIDSYWIKCIQEKWKQSGGTTEGEQYPNLDKYYGKKYIDFINDMNKINERIYSPNKEENVSGIMGKLGLKSAQTLENEFNELPKDDTTRGAETVWFYITSKEDQPVILRCDAILAKYMSEYGSIYPNITETTSLSSKYDVPNSNIAFTTAFEVRPDTNATVSYNFNGGGAVAIGYNQNPFEKTSTAQYDRGDLRTYSLQKNYSIVAPTINVNSFSTNKKNIFVIKWTQLQWTKAQGKNIGNTFKFDIKLNNVIQDSSSPIGVKDIYLTQEPLAPWLQYEVITKENLGVRTTNLLEKRWNQPIRFSNLTGNPLPSFDISANSVIVNNSNETIPYGEVEQPTITLAATNSKWQTLSRFFYTSFKTLTILLRPYAGDYLPVGTEVRVFSHGPFCVLNIFRQDTNKYIFRFWNGRTWSNMDCSINTWNFVAFQYNGDNFRLNSITCNIQKYSGLIQNKTWVNTFYKHLSSGQKKSSMNLMPTINYNSFQIENNIKTYSGFLILGSDAGVLGAKMDVKWIHGFRNYLDTEKLLNTELRNHWNSRWSESRQQLYPDCKFNPYMMHLSYDSIRKDCPTGDIDCIRKSYLTNNFDLSPCGSINPTCKFDTQTYRQFNNVTVQKHPNAANHYKTEGIFKNAVVCPKKYKE